MSRSTASTLARARSLLVRAEKRFDGADAVIRREAALQGEFDNGFDGVVSGIFHIVDAFELATTGLRRDPREADQATRITSVVTALRQYGATDLPAASRLIGLNARRNTSVHGEYLDVLDRDELAIAVRAGRMLLAAVRGYLDSRQQAAGAEGRERPD
jgi:hypothetical protein